MNKDVFVFLGGQHTLINHRFPIIGDRVTVASSILFPWFSFRFPVSF